MLPLYRKDQTRHLDQLAAQALGLSGFDLMQKAGASAAATLQELMQDHPDTSSPRTLIIAGNGNNAGDGYVLALELYLAGLPVAVWPWSEAKSLSPDALTAQQQYQHAGGRVLPVAAAGQAEAETWAADWLVDALLGTGINRPVTGSFAQAIDWINSQSRPVFSLDIPSGLDADTGQPRGNAVKASASITFIALKPGLFTAQGPDYCGELFYAPLDVPGETLQTVDPAAWLLEQEDIATNRLRRARECHKGHFGHVLVVGGKNGMLGAAVLAAEAALRSGAGKVTLASPAHQRDAVVLHRPEIMTADPDGPLTDFNNAVLAIGPGLGRDKTATKRLDRFLKSALETGQACVLDADALNGLALITSKDTGKSGTVLPPDTVLTPHPGEAARLLGGTTADVQADRLATASRLADRFHCVAVLKGNGTIISAPGQSPLVCPFGTPGMATAGMGDVLTGVIAALMGQGLSPLEAASAGVLAHALAAEMAGKGNGLLASDVIDTLPELWP